MQTLPRQYKGYVRQCEAGGVGPMISDEDIIAMIVEAATEELPIAVMTVREMRQFAEKVAMDCVAIAEIPNMAKKDIIRAIRGKYEITKH